MATDPITRSGSFYTVPRDGNRVPALFGVSTVDGVTPVAIEVNPATGGIVTSAGAAALPSTLVNGQKAVTASAASLGSGALSQGVLIESLSTNTISVFVGGTGVTTSTGYELQPGATTSVAVSNISAVFVVASTTGATVTWIGS